MGKVYKSQFQTSAGVQTQQGVASLNVQGALQNAAFPRHTRNRQTFHGKTEHNKVSNIILFYFMISVVAILLDGSRYVFLPHIVPDVCSDPMNPVTPVSLGFEKISFDAVRHSVDNT